MRKINSDATEMIPVRLIVSIAIVAAIAFMVVIASSNLRVLLAEQQVEKECRSLESSLCTMLSSGAARDIDETGAAEGTKRIQTFSLPDSLVYLCFGGDPDFSGTGVFQPDLIEDGTVIVYKVEGGSNKVMWLPKETCKFREGTIVDNKWVIAGTGQSYIIHSGGKITLVFECVQKSHQVYILIHGNDGISP